MSKKVQIHLTIHQDGGDLKIDFDFDTANDDINQIVKELVETCDLSPDESEELKQIIQIQVARATNVQQQPATSTPPPASHMSNGSFAPIDTGMDDLSDDQDVLDDPEYKALLEEQERELKNMEQRHQNEQKDLMYKITRDSPSSPSPYADDLLIWS